MDWDYDGVDCSIGLDIYMPSYDGDMKTKHYTFPIASIDTAKDRLHEMVTNTEDEEFMIGINSFSCTNNPYMSSYTRKKHNLFMEWDKKESLPNFDLLQREGGELIKTQHGWHYIKEAMLSFADLKEKQIECNCCPGFMKHSNRRGYSTLRVSPKYGLDDIQIIEPKEGLLYETHKNFLEMLRQ